MAAAQTEAELIDVILKQALRIGTVCGVPMGASKKNDTLVKLRSIAACLNGVLAVFDAEPVAGISAEVYANSRTQALEHLLLARPPREELEERGLLAKSSVAPSLAAKQTALQRKLLENKLSKHLSHRPTRDELVQHNILRDLHTAPALQQRQIELMRRRLEDMLTQKLANRPSRDELMMRNILTDADAAAEANAPDA